MGYVTETTRPPNDQTDSSTGRVRETPHLPKRRDRFQHSLWGTDSPPDKRHDRTDHGGHVTDTPHPPNDETDSNTGRVRGTPQLPNDETGRLSGGVSVLHTLCRNLSRRFGGWGVSLTRPVLNSAWSFIG